MHLSEIHWLVRLEQGWQDDGSPTGRSIDLIVDARGQELTLPEIVDACNALAADRAALLSACKTAEATITETLEEMLQLAGLPAEEADDHPVLRQLRAAIAKAEGREAG